MKPRVAQRKENHKQLNIHRDCLQVFNLLLERGEDALVHMQQQVMTLMTIQE